MGLPLALCLRAVLCTWGLVACRGDGSPTHHQKRLGLYSVPFLTLSTLLVSDLPVFLPPAGQKDTRGSSLGGYHSPPGVSY